MRSVAISVHQRSTSASPRDASSRILETAIPTRERISTAQFFWSAELLKGCANSRRRAAWRWGSRMTKMPGDRLGVMVSYHGDLKKPAPILWIWENGPTSATATSWGAMRTMGPYFWCRRWT